MTVSLSRRRAESKYKTSATQGKWRTLTASRSSSRFRYDSKVKRGSVFDTLFKPEGKALAKLSQAWIEKMKEKKRRWSLRPQPGRPSLTTGLISMEKYFDNLVSILYHSTSTLSSQSV